MRPRKNWKRPLHFYAEKTNAHVPRDSFWFSVAVAGWGSRDRYAGGSAIARASGLDAATHRRIAALGRSYGLLVYRGALYLVFGVTDALAAKALGTG